VDSELSSLIGNIAETWRHEPDETVATTCASCGNAGEEFRRFASASWLCRSCASAHERNESERRRFAAWLGRLPEVVRDCEFNVTAAQRIGSNPSDITRARKAASELRPITISGPMGSGKSMLAGALMRSIFETQGRITVLFVCAIELYDAGVSVRMKLPDMGRALRTIELAKTVRLLIIDDLGAESRGDMSPVDSILFARYNAKLVNWITTGFGPDELARKGYGGGVRRVFERAEQVVLTVRAPRTQAAQAAE
jgi:DNA replication protein DnaC